MRRLPPLRSLEAFAQVARLGSAKAAAAELSLSPSALSRRIAALEDFMGKKLFKRQKQLLALNRDGEALYKSIGPALELLTDAVHANMDTSRTMRLRLGVLPLFGSQRLFPKLPELRRLYPLLHIDIDTSGHGEDRLGDSLDAAIVLTESIPEGLHAVQLDENYVYAIASTDLVKQLGDKPKSDVLSRQTFLIHNDMPESFSAWKAEIGMAELQPSAIDHFDSGPLMLEAAAQGLGIAIMHDNHLDRAHDPRLARLYTVEVKSPYSYWFVCRPAALETRAVRLFHDWLVKAGL
ncbi:LysR substrate-binding domain-containing protein [Alterisphingorhabdus coralli]|uniref:LysR substrate-binding domain-containing protein n=1 Tax=Alterisphingorhabdus coralli TaxID=3071408 RepID=A0AA97I1P8_9SPHN|nr:LysR substrate-binding domain-containing protein [Parasphingorhabdus sp. SCSIO 66989]WOE74975.1 LysR substrate-binding domain-containing protein [Parasphingorhabdus sp. SCSIO 66989]